MTRMTLLLLAGIVLATAAVAQADDAAYCAQLKDLVLRYTGGAGVEGRLMPAKTTLGAMLSSGSAAGDVIFLAHDHAETQASAMSHGEPTRIIGLERG